jgi:hypothetical protein
MRKNSGRNSGRKYFYNIIPIFALDKIFYFLLFQFSCDWNKIFSLIFPLLCQYIFQYNFDFIKYLLIKSWKIRQNSGQIYLYNIIPIFALDKIFSFILSQFSCDWIKYFLFFYSNFLVIGRKYFPLYLPYYVNIYFNIILISSNIYWWNLEKCGKIRGRYIYIILSQSLH